jgi:hypothetical protein
MARIRNAAIGEAKRTEYSKTHASRH